jgi:TonB-linked outer membrane protein, SusC/RagA family
MRNLKISIVIALFAVVANVFGQSKVETEVVFKFIQQNDEFFFDINSDEIKRLHGYVDKYKTEINSKKVILYVDGYCFSFVAEKENLQTAGIRSNHVKSNLIIKKGLVEDNFITHNYAQKYEDETDVVIVTLRIPGVVASNEPPKSSRLIKGQVISSLNQPIQGAILSAKGAGNAITNSDGTFNLNITGDAQELTAQAEGYLTVNQKFNGRTEIVVTMTPEKKEELVEIMVVEDGGEPVDVIIETPEPLAPVLESSVKGQILSSLNEPIEGAIVSATGAKNATTNSDGAFNMDVLDDAKEFTVWADGYYSQRQTLNGRDEVVVMMIPEDAYKYNESIVLPPSRVETDRPAHTAAVNINKKDFTLGSQRIDRALSGQVAGLRVVQSSGMPGEGSYMNMRGIRTFVGENNPLIVINGVPYLPDNNSSPLFSSFTRDIFQAYNIHDIENITVLKGAEAAMYGSLGSNGVVLIETDGANSNDLSTRVSFYGQYGTTWNNKRIPLMNKEQYQSYLSDVGMTYFSTMYDMFSAFPFLNPDPDDRKSAYYESLYNHDTDWQDLIFRRGFVTDNLFRIEGGDAIAKYDISLGYALEEGLLANTNSQRYHAQFNVNTLVSKKVEINATIGLAYLTGQQQEQGLNSHTNPVYASYIKPPVLSPYNFDDYGNQLAKFAPYYFDYGSGSINMDFATTNPLAAVDMINAHNSQFDINLKASIVYKPTTNLSVTGTVGLYSNNNTESLFIPGRDEPRTILPYTDRFGPADNLIKSGVGQTLNMYFNGNARYQKTFDYIHRLNVVGGIQTITSKREYDAGSGRNSASDFYQTLKNLGAENGRYFFGYLEKWNWLNMYAHADYTYSDKVSAAVNVAVDGASSSGSDGNTLFLYPSAGLTWLGKGWLPISNSTFVNRLNVKAEYGVTGNSYFSSSFGKYYYNSASYQDISGIVRGTLNNTKLRPERNAQFNVELDAAFLQNRVNLTFDYYNNTASDVIMPVPQSSAFGTSTYFENCAKINNSGIEIALQVSLIRTRDFEWIVGGNFAQNKGVVKSLGGVDQIITHFEGGAQLVSKVGEAPYQYYGYKTLGVFSTPQAAITAGLENSKGMLYEAGDIHYADQNGDNVINDRDRVLLGGSAPDFFGGFFTSVNYKGFSLSGEFVYSQGNKAYNAIRRSLESLSGIGNQTLAATNRWYIEGLQADVPRATWGDPLGNNDFSDRWIEDASYIRMRNVTLSYSFDRKLLNVFRSGTIYVTGENLWTYSRYLGLDPEFSFSSSDAYQGIDASKLLHPQVLKLGVNLNF